MQTHISDYLTEFGKLFSHKFGLHDGSMSFCLDIHNMTHGLWFCGFLGLLTENCTTRDTNGLILIFTLWKKNFENYCY